jgi:hypothetical protein
MVGMLLVSAALARTVVAVGERYAPAEHGAWPQTLAACLDAVAPNRFEVADATAPDASFVSVRALLGALDGEDAPLLLLSVGPRARRPLLQRLGWAASLRRTLRAATGEGREVALFGPWPAERVLVRGFGSVPDSYAGVREVLPDRARARDVAASMGVPIVDGRLSRAPGALPNEEAGTAGPAEHSAWRKVPGLGAGELGGLACEWLVVRG